MSDFESRREERRKIREEWRAKFRDGHYMRSGAHIRSGGVWTGVFILLIGVAAFLKASMPEFPDWLFSWPMLLIAFGAYSGIKCGFRGATWLVIMLAGGAFLAGHIMPDLEMRRYIWPIVFIIIGLFFIVSSRSRFLGCGNEKKKDSSRGIEDAAVIDETTDTKEDFINTTSIFGGTKKNILSKNFKGGNIVNIFGGTEIYLGQADINGTAIIETTTIFGGTKLIIPSNWTVKSQAAVIFGGIEDKRSVTPTTDGIEKVLLLKGTVMFGGVDIKSY